MKEEEKHPEEARFGEFSFFFWLCQSEAVTPAVLWTSCCVPHSMASASIHRRADLAEINVQQDAMCDSLSRLALLTGAVNAWKLASVHDAYLVLLSNFLHSLFKTFSKTRRKRKHEGFWVCTDNDNRVTSYLKRTVSGWWHVSKKRRTTNKPIKRCGCLAVSADRMLHLALLGKTTLMFCRQQELHWILISCTSNSR